MGQIEFSKTSQEIKNLVRGLNPWPVAWTKCADDIVKIYSVSVTDEKTTLSPGAIVSADSKNGLKIATGDGVVLINILQLPGKKAMDSKTFFVGNKLKADKFTNEL